VAATEHALLDLTIKHLGTTTEVDVSGEIDEETMPDLEAAIVLALEDEPEHLVIDLRMVESIDPAAERVLDNMAAPTEAAGVSLVVLRPDGSDEANDVAPPEEPRFVTEWSL
jgi:anti-anti-sigma factor